jgi:hypothetical protein
MYQLYRHMLQFRTSRIEWAYLATAAVANKEPDNDKDRNHPPPKVRGQPAKVCAASHSSHIERDGLRKDADSFQISSPFEDWQNRNTKGGFGPHPPEAKPRQYGEVK